MALRHSRVHRYSLLSSEFASSGASDQEMCALVPADRRKHILGIGVRTPPRNDEMDARQRHGCIAAFFRSTAIECRCSSQPSPAE